MSEKISDILVIYGKGTVPFEVDDKIMRWGVNHAGLEYACDALITWDNKYLDYYKKNFKGRIETLKVFGGLWTPEKNRLRRDKFYVANWNASICFALNIAIQYGYKYIFLLGFDNEWRDNKFYKGKEHFKNDYARHFARINMMCSELEKGLINERIFAVNSKLKPFEKVKLNTIQEFYAFLSALIP